MKYKNKVLNKFIAIFVLMCFAFTGCKTYYWKMLNSVDNINNICIVSLFEEEETLLKNIDRVDYVELINDIESLKAHKYIGDPTYPSGNIFKVSFSNGEKDLISQYEPRHVYFINGELYDGTISRLCFNQKEFNELIEKWLKK